MHTIAYRGERGLSSYAVIFLNQFEFLSEEKTVYPCTARGGRRIVQSSVLLNVVNFDDFEDDVI